MQWLWFRRKKSIIKRPHSIILENRHNMTVAGVSDIDSFDEQTVVLFTDMGELTIKGFNLHINKLNVETGELTLEGDVYFLEYADDQPGQKSGLFSRLFK